MTAQYGELATTSIDAMGNNAMTYPKRLVFSNACGAKRSDARPTRVREARNSMPFPEEKALVITTALMIDGSTYITFKCLVKCKCSKEIDRTLIPAVWKASTKGDEAVAPPVPSRGSSAEIRRPTNSRDRMYFGFS